MQRMSIWLTVLLVLLLTACGGAASEPMTDPTGQEAPLAPADETDTDPAAKLNVVATTGHIADTVANIGGDAIEVINLLGPGIDPHTYVPTEGDIRRLETADVIFYNGVRLEVQMEDVLEQLAQRDGMTVVAVGDELDGAWLLEWEPEEGLPYDPHIWNDVTLWMEVVEVMRDTLIAVDPANTATYTANTEAYLAEMEELHAYILAQAATIPAERRVLVTAHDAFSYFGQAYDFQVEAVQGISTDAEASAADIQELADVVVEKQVPAIFIETIVSPRSMQALQEAIQAGGLPEIAIGGEILFRCSGRTRERC